MRGSFVLAAALLATGCTTSTRPSAPQDELSSEEQAAEQRRKVGEAYFFRGRKLMKQGQFGLACAALKKCVQHDPDRGPSGA